jgi:hypothetical protein
MAHSGNFWWANCDHVASLQPLPSRFDSYVAEFFVLTTMDTTEDSFQFARQCAYDAFSCRDVDHYHDECPFSSYAERLERLTSSYPLVSSTFQESRDIGRENRSSVCFKIDRKPYTGKPFRYDFQLVEGYGLG